MKRLLLLVLALSFGSTGRLTADCKSDACKQATAWKEGYTAVVLADDVTPQEYRDVRELFNANKGHAAIETDRALLGWLPPGLASKLSRAKGVKTVVSGPTSGIENLARDDNTASALRFYNRVKNGEYEDDVEKGLTVHGEPLRGCILSDAHHLRSTDATAANGVAQTREAKNGRLQQRTWGSDPIWGWSQPFKNAEMRGRVTVQVFRLESDGSRDANEFSWNTADFNTATDQAYGAFTFWANQALARGVDLSFYVGFPSYYVGYPGRTSVLVTTGYEPVRHPSTDDYRWANDALAHFGYGASPITPDGVMAKNEAFNDARLNGLYGPYDHSFSVYIVYNPPELNAPTQFTDSRAYAMPDGPFTMVLWNSSGWGGINLGRVIAHETAHIFWAPDEYWYGNGDGCGSCKNAYFNVGPRNQLNHPEMTNANCAINPTLDGSDALCVRPPVPCMMSTSDFSLCPSTPAHIGWTPWQ